MAKTCNCGCGRPVFSHGYAKYCQWKRTDDKKPKKLQYHAFKCKGRSLALESALNFGFEDQLSMFQTLWENARNEKGEVYCMFTGEKLNFWAAQESWYYCLFAHVLPKKNYPYFKLNPDNICIVHPEFHRIVDQGTTKDREAHPDWKWDEWDALVIETKQKYIEFKRKNLLA